MAEKLTLSRRNPSNHGNPSNCQADKDVMVCDICMELYDESKRQPKFLSCHHSYCKSCLMQFAGDQENIECPSCRQVTKLTPGGIPALQTNFYISQWQDTLKQVGSDNGCRKHYNQPMSFFCRKCAVMICRDCTVLDHKQCDGHEMQDVLSADPEQRELLKSQVAIATATFEEVQGQLGHLEAETQNIRCTREHVHKEVCTAFEKYHKVLEVRKLQILKELTDGYNTKQAGIIQNAEAIGSSLKKMAKALSHADRLPRQGPLQQVISTRANLAQTTQDVKQLILGMEPDTNDILFDAKHGELDFQAAVAQLGKLLADNRLPVKVQFDIPELVATRSATINLRVYNNEDKQLSGAGIMIIIIDHEGDRLCSSINWDKTNTGSITFTPQIGGLLDFKGTFHGRVISGAKTSVNVVSNNPVCILGAEGTGQGKFQSPRAITVDSEGYLFVADTGNRVIQKLDNDGNFIQHFEIGDSECHHSTCDVALCEQESLVVCTETTVGTINNPTSGNTVLIYNKHGDLQRKFTNKSMRCALCVATNSHNEIIVSDYLKHCLYMYNTEGSLIRKIGHSNSFNHPAFICVTADDRIIVSDTNADNIQIFNREGQRLHKFGRSGSKKGQLKQPFGIASDGEHLLVVDSGNKRIQVFKMDGTFVSAIESLDEPLDQPRGIAVTKDGHVYVADRDNHCVKKYRYK